MNPPQRRGPKPNPKTRRRPRGIPKWLDSEWARVEAKAKAEGLTTSAFVRRSVLRACGL